MNKIWHYAPWTRLSAIVKSGELLASNARASEEKPMLWFSKHQKWEPTATKMIRTRDGNLTKLSFREQAEKFGCIRFGLDAQDLRVLPWQAACNAAGTPENTRLDLERAGRLQGAHPDHWFATDTPIALTELHFQIWIKGWHPAECSEEMAMIWTNHRRH